MSATIETPTNQPGTGRFMMSHRRNSENTDIEPEGDRNRA